MSELYMNRTSAARPILFENLPRPLSNYGFVILNKDKFLQVLNEVDAQKSINSLKNKIHSIKEIVVTPKTDQEGLLNIEVNGGTVSLRRDILVSELNQILEAQTFERAKYYLKRLESGIKKIKTTKTNDINLLRWKEYDEILTDSLWILDKRDASGV